MGWDDLAQIALGSVTRLLGVKGRITYFAEEQPGIEIDGVFMEKYQPVDPLTGAPVSSVKPAVLVRLSDLIQEPRKADRVTIRPVRYRVIESQPDGEGGSVLILEKL